MAYTEIKERNENKYYYRVLSLREGKKTIKKREYLGVNLPLNMLNIKEKEANTTLLEKKKKRKKEVLKDIKKIIINVLKKYNIKKASVFGSYARGEQKKNSDVDIIIEPPKNLSLFGFTGIKLDLENNLNKKVDLLTYNSIHPLIKKYVKKEEVVIL